MLRQLEPASESFTCQNSNRRFRRQLCDLSGESDFHSSRVYRERISSRRETARGSFLHSIHLIPNSKYMSVTLCQDFESTRVKSVGTVLDLGLSSGDRDIAIIQHTSLYSSPGSRIQSHWVMVAMVMVTNAFDLRKGMLFASRENLRRLLHL